MRGWTGGGTGVEGSESGGGGGVRNRGWRRREAGVEGAGIEGAGSMERLWQEIVFFYIEHSKKMAVLGL